MSQYQPPHGNTPGHGQHPGYGQPVQPSGGYGQASVPQSQEPGGFGQGSVPQPGSGQGSVPQAGYADYGQGSVPQAGYGQASVPQQAAPGYGQLPGGFTQQPGGFTQPGGYAQQHQSGPGYGAQYPTSGNPGLFDTTFAVSSTQQTAKLAYIAVIIFAGVLALTAIFRAIGQFSAVRYGGVSSVLGGLTSLILYGALAFGVLTVGRLVIDFFVQEDKKRQQR